MSVFSFPRNLRRMLTFLPQKRYLPYIRKALRTEYNASDLSEDEALLISHGLAYDQAAARHLLKTSGKTAVQLVAESPYTKPRANWRKRLKRWLMRMEGSESFEAAHNRLMLPEHRKDIVEEFYE